MPKMKTNRSAAKRFWKSGKGKVMRRHAFMSHLQSHKTKKQKRRLGHVAEVFSGDVDRIEKMIPYK